jgi:hypothetical protein
MECFRRDLSGWLPERLGIAAANYRQFTAVDPPDDTKAFAAHQAACRASLAHIHLLMRLAHWVENTSDPLSKVDEDDLDRLFDEAEIALKSPLLDEG